MTERNENIEILKKKRTKLYKLREEQQQILRRKREILYIFSTRLNLIQKQINETRAEINSHIRNTQ